MAATEGLGPFTLARTSCHEVASAAGVPYRIMLAWPDAAPPEAGFPAIYLLDAGASFASLVEGLRLRTRRSDATGVVPGVIVGIEHGEGVRGRHQRTFDYTVGAAHDAQLVDGDPSGQAPTGGADAFLSFLQEDLAAFVDRVLPVPVDRGRRSLYGHSMGGRFALHALCHAPQSFASYVAVSPSLWWDRTAVVDTIGALAADGRRPLAACRVLIGAAEYDQELAPWQHGTAAAAAIANRRRVRRMVDDARMVAAALEPLTAQTTFEFFAGEDHASVVARGLGSCLRFCLGVETRHIAP